MERKTGKRIITAFFIVAIIALLFFLLFVLLTGEKEEKVVSSPGDFVGVELTKDKEGEKGKIYFSNLSEGFSREPQYVVLVSEKTGWYPPRDGVQLQKTGDGKYFVSLEKFTFKEGTTRFNLVGFYKSGYEWFQTAALSPQVREKMEKITHAPDFRGADGDIVMVLENESQFLEGDTVPYRR